MKEDEHSGGSEGEDIIKGTSLKILTDEERWEIALDFRDFVGGIVKKYAIDGLLPSTLEKDALHSGLIVIYESLDKFDPLKGSLETYVFNAIRGKIMKAVLDQAMKLIVELTARNVREVMRLEGAQNHLEMSFGRMPSKQELAELLSVPSKAINRWSVLSEMMRSPHVQIREDNGDIPDDGRDNPEQNLADIEYDQLCWKFANIARSLAVDKPKRGSDQISKVHFMDLVLHICQDLSFNEIGKTRGVSGEAVRSMLEKTIGKLRRNSEVQSVIGDYFRQI